MLNSLVPVFSGAGGAGGAASFDSIATVNGTGSSSTISFTSIPSTYKHLQIRALLKSTATGTGIGNCTIQFNSDNGSNYAWHALEGDGATVTAWRGTGTNLDYVGGNITGNVPYAGETNIFGVAIIDILDYASTSKNKVVRAFTGADKNAAGGGIKLGSNLWLNTAAITSISLIDQNLNWATTSTFALYGIKG